MLQAINTKILLGILATLLAIGSVMTYQRIEAHRAAVAAEKAAQILEQQQKSEQEKKDREDAIWKKAREIKAKHDSSNATKTDTWKTYVP